RTKALADSTRITIDLDDSVEYSSARISNPDRIFFDLHGIRLTPELARASIRVEGDMLTAVRLGQSHAGVVRVVLDVSGVKDYTASLQSHPPELVIDLYRDAAATRTAKSSSGASESGAEVAKVDAGPTMPDAKRVAATPASVAPASNVASSASRDTTAATTVPAAATPTAATPTAATQRSTPMKAVATKPATASKPDLIRPPSAAHPTRDGQA